MPRTATFEFKAPSPQGTGGGYPRWRSWEHRPHSTRQGKEDVYVPVHRLAAVAWLLEDGTLGADVHLADLDGYDVHHELGMPSATVESELALRSHGRHSEITQSQVRAWGMDAKDAATESVSIDDAGACAHCGATADVLVTADAFEGARCLECGRQAGATDFEVV